MSRWADTSDEEDYDDKTGTGHAQDDDDEDDEEDRANGSFIAVPQQVRTTILLCVPRERASLMSTAGRIGTGSAVFFLVTRFGFLTDIEFSAPFFLAAIGRGCG